MDHHIIATDARDLLAHWTEGTIEHQQPTEDHKPSNNNVHSSPDDCGIKQKSRRSLTEAERGLTAEPNALRPATTKAGKQRIRMKWSNDVNQFIMRTYYTITSNETQTKSYRDHLHRLFAMQYPDVAISQQRIADQRRAIVKNNLLPKAVLDAIKDEVAQSLQIKNFGNSTVTIVKQEPPNTTITTTSSSPSSTSTAHIVTNHQHHLHNIPVKSDLLQQQNQLGHAHPHHQQHHHHSIPMQMSTTGGLLHQTTRIHQASPTTAAALQNQPHIIIRVNSTAPPQSHGNSTSLTNNSSNSNATILKHHFVDERSSI